METSSCKCFIISSNTNALHKGHARGWVLISVYAWQDWIAYVDYKFQAWYFELNLFIFYEFRCHISVAIELKLSIYFLCSRFIDWLNDFRFLFPALGGFLYGYDIGSTSCATISIEVCFIQVVNPRRINIHDWIVVGNPE